MAACEPYCSSPAPHQEDTMRTVVRARIDQATKDEAAAILGTIGLTVSDAGRDDGDG